MNTCPCPETHDDRRVVLTGGPSAGKSAVLELAKLFFCEHVHTLPESAGIVFGGRFPRNGGARIRRAAQCAIFHVQHALESTIEPTRAALVLCDRGTPDGSAYWLGEGTLWDAVGTTREGELARYHAVIHLRTPTEPDHYRLDNPLRTESHDEAQRVDARIAEAWAGHPRLFNVPATADFLSKAAQALTLLRELIPPCCQQHVRPLLWQG
jgi:predicted ATPase